MALAVAPGEVSAGGSDVNARDQKKIERLPVGVGAWEVGLLPLQVTVGSARTTDVAGTAEFTANAVFAFAVSAAVTT